MFDCLSLLHDHLQCFLLEHEVAKLHDFNELGNKKLQIKK